MHGGYLGIAAVNCDEGICFGADRRARPRAVLDHHRRALRPADLFGQQTGQDVGTAARRVRNDDLNCFRRLRPRAVPENVTERVEAAATTPARYQNRRR
jgi:hypothetical protein